MGQRRHHYEQAFEAFLRAKRIPYVSIDEARKSLLPGPGPAVRAPGDSGTPADEEGAGAESARSLKSFDFVVYGKGVNLLLDVKGRKVQGSGSRTRGSLQSWVTREDVASLQTWRGLFGPGFDAGFVFLYWCEAEPPDGLFQEIFEHHGRWYALRAVRLDAYMASMRARSERWGTVHVAAEAFERISQPFCAPERAAAARERVAV